MCLMCMRHRTLEADQAVSDDGRPEQFADMGVSSSELRLYHYNNRLGGKRKIIPGTFRTEKGASWELNPGPLAY